MAVTSTYAGKLLRLIVPILAIASVASCSPVPALAVGPEKKNGAFEITYTACKLRKVETVSVTSVKEGVISDHETVLWKIEFSPPRAVAEFEVGVTPPGARTKVSWIGRRGAGAFRAIIHFANGSHVYSTEKFSDLRTDQVYYHGSQMSISEFRHRNCDKAT